MPTETFATRIPSMLGLALAVFASCAEARSTEPRRPNVIFILADDQGWGDTGFSGHPYARTPNLDRLAADGTVVTNFYVNGTVCSPSRAACMTGMYPARLGFHHITSQPEVNRRREIPDWLDPDVTTLADTFKRAGYTTAHFGKWHLGKYAGSPAPTAYGFDVAAVSSGSGEQLAEKGENEDPFRLTAAAFDRAIAFIREQKGGPFFVDVWSPLPHAPLRPGPEQRDAFLGLEPDPKAFGEWMADYVRAAKEPAAQMMTYLAAIAEVDHQIGRLRAALAELALTEDTIIVFTSDNGPEDYSVGNASNGGMGSPGAFRGRKRSLYEGGTRVPFIAVWPRKIPAGRMDTETILSGVDLLPTLAALAGIPCEATDIDGENLAAALSGGSQPRRKHLHWEWLFEVAGNRAYFAPPLAVRDGRWKFYCDHKGGATQLYDLAADPGESEDVSTRHPDVVDRLRDSALAWVASLPHAGLRDKVAEGADRMTLYVPEPRPKTRATNRPGESN
jgi:arylsulfatase A-like enzyme